MIEKKSTVQHEYETSLLGSLDCDRWIHDVYLQAVSSSPLIFIIATINSWSLPLTPSNHHSLIMRSTFLTTVALSFNGAQAANNTLYHYMPVDFEYGADSRVTADIKFGMAPAAEPVRIVMDSGSANFWVRFHRTTYSFANDKLDMVTKCHCELGIAIFRSQRALQRQSPSQLRSGSVAQLPGHQPYLCLCLCRERQNS